MRVEGAVESWGFGIEAWRLKVWPGVVGVGTTGDARGTSSPHCRHPTPSPGKSSRGEGPGG